MRCCPCSPVFFWWEAYQLGRRIILLVPFTLLATISLPYLASTMWIILVLMLFLHLIARPCVFLPPFLLCAA